MKAVVFIIVLLICGVLISVGVFLTKKGYDSLSWPTTTGYITSNKVEESVSESTKNSSKTWTVQITYHYQVKNQVFIGQRITFKGMDGTKSGAYVLAAKYKLAKKVIVFYNPKNLKDTVLEPGYNHFGIFFIVGPLVFLAIWIYVLFINKRVMCQNCG